MSSMIGSTALTKAEFQRYSRHIVLPEVGIAGQKRLKAASVLCVGAGGLGSPAALYLAAAGVGRIGLVDDDSVDTSNLQRQVLYRAADVGHEKLEAARRVLEARNHEIAIETHVVRLSSKNAIEILSGYDVIIDGTDNFPARFLINDACVLLGKPDVWASIYRFEGQASVFDAKRGPCYRCLFPEMPAADMVPSCEEAGVLGVLPGLLGVMQATEAIKLILGIGDPLIGRLLIVDALGARYETLTLTKDPDCPVCGQNPTITSLADHAEICETPAVVEDPVAADDDGWTVSVEWLKGRLDTGRSPVMIDCRQPFERQICHLEDSLLMPMAELQTRLKELDSEAETIVLCHHGPRSFHATRYMRSVGFSSVRFLEGGLEEWALRIDTSMARY